jgi:tripartite-type tricarboxylate transporter receptor subunit TctC
VKIRVLYKNEGEGRIEMTRSKKIVAIVFCSVFLSVVSSWAQETYPSKPVNINVAAAPGGTLDLLSRMFSDKFREYLGQPFVVVNKAGAGQAMAMAYVATSKPDGYNIFAAGGASLGYLRLTNPSVTYGVDDFAAIAGFCTVSQVIAVHKDLPVKNLNELVAYAKKNPGALSYGTTGVGGADHFLFELFKSTANIPTGDIPLIPYTGVAPAITALVGNQVQVVCCPFSAIITKQLEAGTIRALAFCNPKRSRFASTIPTTVEQGFKDVQSVHYQSFWFPAKTPTSIVKKVEETTRRATEDKEVRSKMEQLYVETEFIDSEGLRKNIEEAAAKWAPLIKRLNIRSK